MSQTKTMNEVIKYDVGIVGLGYVGLTLATVLAEVGLRVLGVEKRHDVVNLTNAGKPHFSETGLPEALARVIGSGNLTARAQFDKDVSCDIYIITVGTPLNNEGVARLDMIEAASRSVADNMPDGALIILRSTVKIGTSRDIVIPILAASGKSFDIAMSPERTLEGKALQELRELPQIVGADRQIASDRASALFRQITNSIVQVSSLESAEIVKLVDNTFRDAQFAFANEVARVCEAFGVNAQEVIASGKLGYNRTNVPLPGLVGGPCLEKDPHILFQSAQTRGVELEITRACRHVNERQPYETISFISKEMSRRGIDPRAKIALLGMAFKGIPATDDLRGSMSLKVLDALLKTHPDARVHIFDPVISDIELGVLVPGHTICKNLDEAVRRASVVIIANNHPHLACQLPSELIAKMSRGGFIYDYWNHFSNLTKSELGNSYYAVGNTRGAYQWHNA
jgi:UDP-N-acetyl-D-mannosaminuronic acid dehydrogenase